MIVQIEHTRRIRNGFFKLCMSISVIVIDDDIDTLEVFAEFLEIKDVNVMGRGHDGREAVYLYKQHHPDFVLMDVMMPGYDGFYGIERIREINPDAKIIMITADVSLNTKKRLKTIEPSAVITKPYEIDDLLQLMQSLQNGQTAVVSTNSI